MHVAAGKKCQYVGNCTFAHSTEERDLWTFMKENNSESPLFAAEFKRLSWPDVTLAIGFCAFPVADSDQLYDKWLQSQKAGWSEENANVSVRENGKPIHMPTDYLEEVVSWQKKKTTIFFTPDSDQFVNVEPVQ